MINTFSVLVELNFHVLQWDVGYWRAELLNTSRVIKKSVKLFILMFWWQCIPVYLS